MEAAAAAPRPYHLRYAPRIGFLNDLPVPRQLEIYAEYGFRAFEYNGLPRHASEEIAAFRKTMDRLGMSMGVFVVNSGGWRASALVHPKFHGQFLADVRRAVEIHQLIGNECATVTTGEALAHLSVAEQTNHCVEALRRAAELVEKTRLVLVLEPINRRVEGGSYFLEFSAHAAEIVSRVNHPHVRILFDIYHQQISEGNLINHIRQYWDWIGYFQVGDVPGRKEPGTGEINYRNVFQAIYDKGYQGIVGMEHGLSRPGEAGLRKCFEEYRNADTWD